MATQLPAQEGWLRKHRHYVVIVAAAAGTLVAYKAYRSGQSKVEALQATLAKYSDAAASAGDVLAVLSDDIRQFLASESDELPRSLRQLAKLARSRDVQDTLSACISSAVRGMLTSPPAAADGMPAEPSVVDKVIEALLSNRGQSLVALAIKTAAQQSTETFCSAVRQGLEAALGSPADSSSTASSTQQQGPASPSGSVRSTSAGSPGPHHQQQHLQHHHHHRHSHPDMHPALVRLLAVMSSPQMLHLINALVSTSVGSAVGAYISKAGSNDVFTSALNALGKPGNKDLVVDMMSSVSAAFCREMAAACVAPAAAVASRPASRLGGPDLEQQHHHQQQQLAQLQDSRMGSLMKPVFPHNRSQDGLSIAGTDEGSEPSTPQSGPGTPEPSVAAAAALPARNSFAGSAVGGLVLRRNSFPGLGGWGSSTAAGGDLATLGPMSTLVSLFVQAARFQEFRSLMVDVSRSSTREFVVSLLPSGILQGWPTSTAMASPAFTACMYRVYTMVSVMMFLMVYALGPKAMMEAGM